MKNGYGITVDITVGDTSIKARTLKRDEIIPDCTYFIYTPYDRSTLSKQDVEDILRSQRFTISSTEAGGSQDDHPNRIYFVVEDQ